MLKFLDRDINFFDVELTNNCALKCPRCPRTQDPITLSRRDIDESFFHFAFPSRLKGLNKSVFHFEGNYGDCIYNPHLFSIIKYLKQSFNAQIRIVTNGSGKTEDYWRNLIGILDKDDEITFSIDGLAHSNHLYRIGSNWSSILNGINLCVGKVKTIWKMVYFSHNENELNEIQLFAKKIGVDEFLMVKSKRFHIGGVDDLRPTRQDLISPISENKTLIKNDLKKKNNEEIVKNIKLRPHCISSKEEFNFISYDGHLSPCCVTAIYKERDSGFPFIDDHELKNLTDLRLRPIDEVLSDERWLKFYELNNSEKRQTNACYKRCGLHTNCNTEISDLGHLSYLPTDRIITKI